MRKILSLLLICTLIFSFPIMKIFAYDNTDSILDPSSSDTTASTCVQELKQDNVISAETDGPLVSDDQLDDTSSADTWETKFFSFQETSVSFMSKIASDTMSLCGTVVDENGNSMDLSEFFSVNQISRFDIVDIAHENKILSETEKIDAYCSLLEKKKYENSGCIHDVITALSCYAWSERAPVETKKRIESIFSLPDTASSEALSSALSSASALSESSQQTTSHSYTSAHFVVYYQSEILESEAQNTANYLETIRTKYITEYNFRAPILDVNSTRYQVHLFPAESNDGNNTMSGSTNPITQYGSTCSTYTSIFSFSSLTTEAKEILAHEYFHAIQAAYKWENKTNLWFDEATANWGSIAVNGTSTICDQQIQAYINSSASIYNSGGYGAVLFPLIIQRACGTDAIKAIWEKYGEQTSTSLSFSQFKAVVDEALSPWNHTFDAVFYKMAYSNFAPDIWYRTVHPGGYSATSAWAPFFNTDNTTSTRPRASTYTTLFDSASIQPYDNNYHVFRSDLLNKASKLTIVLTLSGSDVLGGVCQAYYVKSDGTHVASTLNRTTSNSYTITCDVYGSDVVWYGVVLSNVSDSALTYSLQYKVDRGSTQTVSLSNVHRYYEGISELSMGEYKDYLVTFSVSGSKLLQTFGRADAYLELYDSSGTRLAYNDDGGYISNAMISYNFTANTTYRIRVTLYSASAAGTTKLVILPCGSYAQYEDIYSLTDYTMGLTWSFVQNQVQPMTYQFSTTQVLTMHVTSSVDPYLYIIDPRSAEPLAAASTSQPASTQDLPCLYNDDYGGTRDSQITKTFQAGIPYLVLVSMYNPSSSPDSFYVNFPQ